MKCTVESAALAKALQALSGVVPGRSAIPILNNALLKVGADVLTMTAFDLDMESSVEIPVADGEDGAVTAPFGPINRIGGKSAKASQITMLASKDRIVVRDSIGSVDLPTLPAKDFPRLEPKEWLAEFEIDASVLTVMRDRTASSIAQGEAQPYLCGTYWHVVDGEMIAVSTDSHRLAKFSTPIPDGADAMPGIIVPDPVMRQAAKLASSIDGSVSVSASRTMIRFAAGRASVTSRLIDGTFPDYARIIPNGNSGASVIISRQDLGAAVDRMAMLGDGATAIKFKPASDGVELMSADANAGSRAIATVQAEWTGDPVPFDLNSRYVRDGMAALPAGDDILINTAAPGAPTVWRVPGEDNVLHLIVAMW